MRTGRPDGRREFSGRARCEVTFKIVTDDMLITDLHRLY